MKKIRLDELVFDEELYPRGSVDSTHVGVLAEAIRAGAKLPPIVVCAATMKIIDGVHRSRAYRRVQGDDAKVEALARRYDSDADRFRDAVRLNAGHGRRLSSFDQARCLTLADRLQVPEQDLAADLALTVEAIGELRADRIGSLSVDGRPEPESVPLKRTVRHLAGRHLTRAQREGNQRLGGMSQLFYVNQVITLLESDLLDESNERLIERLRHLLDLAESKLGALQT